MSLPGARRRRVSCLFDSGALITSAKFSTRGQLVVDHLLVCCRVVIIPEVKHETIDAGLLSGYPDATELANRVGAGRIRIVGSGTPDTDLEPILAQLGLQDTDRTLLHTCRAMARQTRFVTDDHRLWVTATRLGLTVTFLPDLIVWLADRGRMAPDLAGDVLQAIQPRYAVGFVELSVKRLEGIF